MECLIVILNILFFGMWIDNLLEYYIGCWLLNNIDSILVLGNELWLWF